ncbi:hypothetical protein YYG_02780 [Plasmodium vinckei petteri]|nr:hypothetical protein YYG_02780 [Plasmodium vinckei petteri]
MEKTKCSIKIRKNEKSKENKKPPKVNIFDEICKSDENEEEEEEDDDEHKKKIQKVEKITSMKDGNIFIEQTEKDIKNMNDREKANFNFINNLKKKLDRVNNKNNITYLNYFPNGNNQNDNQKLLNLENSDGYDSNENLSDVEMKDINNFIIKKSEVQNSEHYNNVSNDEEEINKNDTVSNGEKLNSFNNMDDTEINHSDDISNFKVSENSLAFKRKQILDRFNKKDKEYNLKNELNFYQDFKEHNIKIENYGLKILKKMGYNEDIYNQYINTYYNTNDEKNISDKNNTNANYYDKIYEYFSSRQFRFTGVGAEDEMKENMEKIKHNDKNEKEENSNDSRHNTDEDNQHSEQERDTKEKKKKKHDKFYNSSSQFENKNRDKNTLNNEEKEDENYIDNCNNFFEGLLVKINLKEHEFYKRKGIIIYKKKRRKKKQYYYGLLIFKTYKHISTYKKYIMGKIDEFLEKTEKHSEKNYEENDHEQTEYAKNYWRPIIKKLNAYTESNSKKLEFDFTEVKSYYLETVINDECLKCKVVNKNIYHPSKNETLYKETAELKKIKEDRAYIQVHKKYDLKVSLDDICQYIGHV